jgi:uracil-DNA glycosylase
MQQQLPEAVVQRLESLQRAGVSHIKKVLRRGAAAGSAGGARNGGSLAVGPHPSPLPEGEGTCIGPHPSPLPEGEGTGIIGHDPGPLPEGEGTSGDRSEALAAVARDVAACSRCAELARTRTQTVFGVGNPHTRLVFCGEAPGADEDRLGEPFVGRAGQLLTDIIVKGMKMRREDVYILNILRCRPPGNRNPLPIEAAACREFLDRQLAIIQPEFICCLGAVAAQNLLGVETPIGRLRGRVHDLYGIKVVCTYHPAYLLRNPSAKRYVWDDIKLLMAEMANKPDGT